MKSLEEILTLSADFLEGKGIGRPKREAEELVADQLGCKRIDLFLQYDRVLSDDEIGRCRDALKQRAEHTPLAYISGRIAFAGIDLKVSRAVLIPRPETEILVEMIAKKQPTGKWLDLCCGSGAIGLALKHRFPDLDITLADLSDEALSLAKENAEALGLEVTFVKSDLLDAVDGPFDGIICNPPYVSAGEYEELTPEVKQEPKMALVSGSTGFECYEKLAATLDVPQAFFEIGTGMGEHLKKLFESHGYQCTVEADYAGHDRYLLLHR